MKLKSVLVGVMMISVFIACSSSPLDKKFSSDDPDKDFEELETVLPLKEFNVITSFILINIGSSELDGKSYSEIMDEANDYEEEFKEKEEAKKIKEKELQEKEYERIILEMIEKGEI